MSKLKQLLGQTVIYGASSIVGRFLNYLLTPLFTSAAIFSPDQFGIITEMYAYVAFLVVLLTYGMETTYFRFSNQEENNENMVYKNVLTSLISSTGLFIFLAIFFSQTIANWLKYPEHAEYVVWFALIVGLDALGSIPLARLRKENKAKKFAVVNLVNIGVFISMNLFFLVYCRLNYETNSNWLIDLVYSPSIGVGYVFISNLLASVIKFSMLIPQLKIKLGIDKQLMSKMLWYSGPLLLAGVAGIINETLDRTMLKELLYSQNIENGLSHTKALVSAQTQLGIYGANYKITMIIAMAIQAYRYAAEPFFFKEAESGNANKTYALIMNYFVIVVCIMFLGISLNLQVFRYFTPNEAYWVGLSIVPILLFANLSLGVYFNQSVWYKLSNKTIYGAFIALVGATITVVINYLYIPTYGYVASAWATLICYVSMMLVSYFLGRKHYPIPYNLRKIGIYVLVALVLFFARYRQDLTGEFSFGVLGYHFLLLLVFLGIVVFLEQKTLKRILPKRFK
jgi:O-antigen/teichoic acid export membrane protein